MRIEIRFRQLLFFAVLCFALAVRPALATASMDWIELFSKVSPAVVNISTTTLPKKQVEKAPSPDLEQLPPIFRYFFDNIPKPGDSQPRRSLGSGFIISADGYILTNNHVVEGADEIVVRLSDRRELRAKLVGSDKRTDLALLKVKADNLPLVITGSSEGLKPGQPVAAIGSPFGFDHSITSGIVSAINRSLPDGQDNYVPFIQTDVPINPGNSGGPLLDRDGKVVGINSQIYTRSGGFMGLSFAIPIDTAMDVVNQLRTTGHVIRGWLGVYVQEVSNDMAESFGLKKSAGALVAQTVPGSPAAKAKLQPGDIIISFDGNPIQTSGDLPHMVGTMKPGDKIKMVVIRDGKRLILPVTIEALPSEDGKEAAKGAPEKNNRLGVEVRTLSASPSESKGKQSQGVEIVAVAPQGLAGSLGLRQGDVISSINNQNIKTLADFNKLIGSLKSKVPNNMRIIRDKTALYLTFRLPK